MKLKLLKIFIVCLISIFIIKFFISKGEMKYDWYKIELHFIDGETKTVELTYSGFYNKPNDYFKNGCLSGWKINESIPTEYCGLKYFKILNYKYDVTQKQ